MVLVAPALLAIMGGSFLLFSGVRGSVGLFGFLLELLSEFVPKPFDTALYLLMMILSFFASLGGVSAILGGFLIWHERLTTGKLLIRLGCGTGLLGFSIQLIARAIFGPDVLMAFLASLTGSTGGIGLLLCLSAMLLAKKPPKKAKEVEEEAPAYRRLRPL